MNNGREEESQVSKGVIIHLLFAWPFLCPIKFERIGNKKYDVN